MKQKTWTVRASGGSTFYFRWTFWIVEPSKQIFRMQFWRFHAQLLTDTKVAGPLCGDHIFRSFLDCKRPTIHLAIMWWSSLSSFSSCDHHPRISQTVDYPRRVWKTVDFQWFPSLKHWPGEVWRNTTTVWVIWRWRWERRIPSGIIWNEMHKTNCINWIVLEESKIPKLLAAVFGSFFDVCWRTRQGQTTILIGQSQDLLGSSIIYQDIPLNPASIPSSPIRSYINNPIKFPLIL